MTSNGEQLIRVRWRPSASWQTQADRRDRGRKERGPCGYQAVPHL